MFVPYIPKAIKLSASDLEKFTGTYTVISSGNDFEIIKNGDFLYRKSKGNGDVELKPESNTRLFYADGSDRFINFEFDKTGTVTKATLLNGVVEIKLQKK